MKPLTNQQRAALEVSDASVVLATGAGCGKTRVLTDKYVRMLAEGRVPVARMVALTFTDKAAGELRRRVRQACRERLDAGEDREYWRGVLLALEAAPIGTFHTFCGQIVRRFAARAGVDPGFVVLDESVAATCREEAVDAAIRAALVRRDAGLRALAESLGLGAVRDRVVELLSDRSAETLGDWAEADPTALVTSWRAAFDEHVRPAVLGRFRLAARPCLEMIRGRRDGFPAKMAESIAAIVELVGEIAGADRPEDLLARAREHAKMPRGLLAPKWPDPELYEPCKQIFGSFRQDVDRALKGLASDDASTELAARLGVALSGLAAGARREFDRVKRRRGALDFDDLLLVTRDLLRDGDGPVRDALLGQYDLILVDEFQDTDPVQDEIVRRVAGDDLAGGRLFLVGDAKQSIYGFRGARPDLFERYRGEFPEEGRLPLTENFRSRRGVIDFVNALFAEAFSDYEPISAAGEDRLDPDLPCVVFAWPPAAREEEDSEASARGTRPDAKARRSDEARRLAKLVRSWIEQGRPVRDRETNEPRPIRMGDVAVLFRTLKDAAAYERAMDEEGLDYYVVGGSAFYAQGEVQDVINVLAAIDDPLDSVALAGALRSPFFAMSDEALYWLSTVRRDDLSAGLAHPDEASLPGLDPEDRRRAIRAQDLLTRWRSVKDREPIARLLGRVLSESGFEAALLGEPLGDRKRANARKLVRMARAFDEQGGFALADFVARLKADLKSPPREEQAATTGELGDVVRLMTVHKAKGLEFPVVILPDLDRKADGHRDRVALDPELGPLLNIKADAEASDPEDDDEAKGSLGWLVHRRRVKAEEAAEATRVFYVATTRARDLLVLSTTGEPVGDEAKPALGLLVDRFDPTTGALVKPLPEGYGEPRVEVIRSYPAGVRAPRRKRPALLAMARMIESALAGGPAAPREGMERPDVLATSRGAGRGRKSSGPTSPLPSFIPLDPSEHLPYPAARLDRLVRAVWLDRRTFGRGDLETIAASAGREQVPAAPPRLVGEAVARIRPFVESPLGRQIAGAKQICRGLEWSTTWRGSAVVAGRLDMAFRDKDGEWVLVQVDEASLPEPAVRARLALSARLAPELGCGPIARAWVVAHGPGGGLRGEERFDEASIDRWLAAVISGRRG